MSDGGVAKIDTEPERAKSEMVVVRDTGRTALSDMRQLLGVLCDDEPGSHAPQQGLAQLEALIEQSRAAGLPVALRVEGGLGPVMPDSMELTVYRLVQEALTNVRKHAGPGVSRIDVRLLYEPGELEVRIVNDGRGERVGSGRPTAGTGTWGCGNVWPRTAAPSRLGREAPIGVKLLPKKFPASCGELIISCPSTLIIRETLTRGPGLFQLACGGSRCRSLGGRSRKMYKTVPY